MQHCHLHPHRSDKFLLGLVIFKACWGILIFLFLMFIICVFVPFMGVKILFCQLFNEIAENDKLGIVEFLAQPTPKLKM